MWCTVHRRGRAPDLGGLVQEAVSTSATKGYFASHNNRVQWYDVFAGMYESGDPPGNPLERAMYVYDDGGNPEMIVRSYSDTEQRYFLTRFTYDAGGRAWLLEQWTYDTELVGDPPEEVVLPGSQWRHALREFRYDGGGRARYLLRERDPQNAAVVLSALWTDYDAESVYADYTLAGGLATEQTAYVPGVSQTVDLAGTPQTMYVHGDQIGTSRALSDATSALARSTVFTAFGEPVYSSEGPDTRYGYVGAHGYEGGLIPDWPEFYGIPTDPYVHVGARWYDPATGHFLQRDPIGIVGTINVYAYVRNAPVTLSDPWGLDPLEGPPGYDRILQARMEAFSPEPALAGALMGAMGSAGRNMQESAGVGYKAGGTAVAAGVVLEASGIGAPAGASLQVAGACAFLIAAIIDGVGTVLVVVSSP